MGKLFIQTGATPPRGIILQVAESKPLGKGCNLGTNLVAHTAKGAYRRVYQDKSGNLFVQYFGTICPAFLAQ